MTLARIFKGPRTAVSAVGRLPVIPDWFPPVPDSVLSWCQGIEDRVAVQDLPVYLSRGPAPGPEQVGCGPALGAPHRRGCRRAMLVLRAGDGAVGWQAGVDKFADRSSGLVLAKA
jgi:hypothetical protein